MKHYEEKDFSYFDEVRSEVFALLPDKSERVFEIGCGTGATLSQIKAKGLANWVGGVELVADVVSAGKSNLDLLLEGNIENMELPISHSSLDVILCLDVLEHLVDPWAAVEKLKKYLKPNGVIIASLPNVKNLKVLLPLVLKDDWQYAQCGLLDRTHLRFFTKKTAIALFENAGLHVDTVPTFFNKKGSAGLVNTLTFGLFRSFIQFQYLVRARNS